MIVIGIEVFIDDWKQMVGQKSHSPDYSNLISIESIGILSYEDDVLSLLIDIKGLVNQGDM